MALNAQWLATGNLAMGLKKKNAAIMCCLPLFFLGVVSLVFF
jgi:hypothetical protein